MSTDTTYTVDRQSIAALSQRKQEPEWLRAQRERAAELADRLELPKLEKTRIDRWQLQAFGEYRETAALASLAELSEEARALLSVDNPDNVIVQRDGAVVFNRASERLAALGVIFTDLETAVREHAQLVKPYLHQAVTADEHRLAALHGALWSGGVFLYVPKNVRVEVPVQALFVTTDAEAAFAPHVLIVAEANSSVSYVENYVSAGSGAPVSNSAAEVFVKPGAHVQFASVHSLGETTIDVAYRRAVVENDGKIEWVVGEMNGGNVLSDTTSLLKGQGSNSDAKVICVGTEEQKLNLSTRAVHVGKHSSSDMITRAVMRDDATAIINGITKIEKGATGANGQQTEKVLMLSPKARGDANPILLIDEDDVKAGHAASVGQVNADQIYYLMSRGISRDEATRLIIYGFLAPVVSEIPIGALEEQLQRLVERKLGQ
ncbi:Fe-S cluster assembly protein SufD [Paenibacillus cymbidii]|uniref:Fe-S cluster assembly protein SufD n=1 Tax=Paenibacillus cymbidii TaxID=1639034 RepID=UPI001081E319|nr:Fe-S cluster assembly protein SufD [Paenibacillus cymbidii]